MDPQDIKIFLGAAKRNIINVVASMLEEAPTLVNIIGKGGWTALTWASYEGHEEMVVLLLDQGADPNLQNKDGMTALMWASMEGHAAVAQLLLNKGAIVDKQSKDGNTALIRACYNGHDMVISLLLDRGAKIDTQNKHGVTALMGASIGGHLIAVEVLLNHGATINIENDLKRTALMEAISEGHESIVRLLLDRGAEISTMNNEIASDNDQNNNIRSMLLQAQQPRSHPKCCIIKASEIYIDKKRVNRFAGSSKIYRGKYRGTDVVIKMLRGDGAMQISADDLQYKEIDILSNLHHSRIVNLMGVVLDLPDNYDFMVGLVTEFMPRGSLYDVLHLDTTPPEHRLKDMRSKLCVLRDIADGMLFLHLSDVIHRDLKSPNVLLDNDNRAKICDFGASQILPPNISCATAVVSTPAWSSPESLSDETVRLSTDVYSFGVILWEMLTNSIPWNKVSASAIIVKVSHGESLPLNAVVATYPELIVLLKKCLAYNPNDRPTFEHIVQCLSDLLPACIETERRDPIAYMCPISLDIMEDPVICSDGHTYDRVNIERWLQHQDTSPITNKRLVDKTLRPNHALRSLIKSPSL